MNEMREYTQHLFSTIKTPNEIKLNSVISVRQLLVKDNLDLLINSTDEKNGKKSIFCDFNTGKRKHTFNLKGKLTVFRNYGSFFSKNSKFRNFFENKHSNTDRPQERLTVNEIKLPNFNSSLFKSKPKEEGMKKITVDYKKKIKENFEKLKDQKKSFCSIIKEENFPKGLNYSALALADQTIKSPLNLKMKSSIEINNKKAFKTIQPNDSEYFNDLSPIKTNMHKTVSDINKKYIDKINEFKCEQAAIIVNPYSFHSLTNSKKNSVITKTNSSINLLYSNLTSKINFDKTDISQSMNKNIMNLKSSFSRNTLKHFTTPDTDTKSILILNDNTNGSKFYNNDNSTISSVNTKDSDKLLFQTKLKSTSSIYLTGHKLKNETKVSNFNENNTNAKSSFFKNQSKINISHFDKIEEKDKTIILKKTNGVKLKADDYSSGKSLRRNIKIFKDQNDKKGFFRNFQKQKDFLSLDKNNIFYKSDFVGGISTEASIKFKNILSSKFDIKFEENEIYGLNEGEANNYNDKNCKKKGTNIKEKNKNKRFHKAIEAYNINISERNKIYSKYNIPESLTKK